MKCNKGIKTMEAPEKIYLQVCGDCEENECQSCKFEDLEDNVTWSRDPIFKKDVEYTRTDAFIEKACKWLKENIENYYYLDEAYDQVISIKRILEDFPKAMEE